MTGPEGQRAWAHHRAHVGGGQGTSLASLRLRLTYRSKQPSPFKIDNPGQDEGPPEAREGGGMMRGRRGPGEAISKPGERAAGGGGRNGTRVFFQKKNQNRVTDSSRRPNFTSSPPLEVRTGSAHSVRKLKARHCHFKRPQDPPPVHSPSILLLVPRGNYFIIYIPGSPAISSSQTSRPSPKVVLGHAPGQRRGLCS